MGRPPCCDKVGIKKGPWTPEEDIILVSYIQEHGPGNWRLVPTNTGIGRKFKNFQTAWDPHMASDLTTSHLVSKRYGDKRSLDFTDHASIIRLNQTSTYASSTENISRLLQGWMSSSTTLKRDQEKQHQSSTASAISSLQCYPAKVEQESYDFISNEEFESLLSIENLSSVAWEKSSSDSTLTGYEANSSDESLHFMSEMKQRLENQAPVSLIENWLLDEAEGQVEHVTELSTLF
ncbi:hypothetical protein HHK36_032268 [Tetracentron sinense]|uniref:Uncharacterized protein n=1 Tax=Tetracentron sinense TaxID=13715 RepID=A0A834YAJ1_TETSI|nr:hypothetical protein HHK36_032268 [Tetracentron sinense]